MLICTKHNSQNSNVSNYSIEENGKRVLYIETTLVSEAITKTPVLKLSFPERSNNSALSYDWLKCALTEHIITECISKSAEYILANFGPNETELQRVFDALTSDLRQNGSINAKNTDPQIFKIMNNVKISAPPPYVSVRMDCKTI